MAFESAPKRRFAGGGCCGYVEAEEEDVEDAEDNDETEAKEDSKKEKPNPYPLLKAVEIMNAKKTVYVGDSIDDVIAAKKGKILSAYVGKNNFGDIITQSTSPLYSFNNSLFYRNRRKETI